MPQLATVRGMPQLSVPLNEPQFFVLRRQNAASVSGEQLQTPALQVDGSVQVPQAAVRERPQRSFAVRAPQVLPRRAQKA